MTDNTDDMLRLLIERIERMEEEKKGALRNHANVIS
jgi:uncharacterized protein (UPF0335 family)